MASGGRGTGIVGAGVIDSAAGRSSVFFLLGLRLLGLFFFSSEEVEEVSDGIGFGSGRA